MSLKGRFRDADFFIPSDEVELGRRTQVHEYPLRDDAYVEDLGKKAGQTSFEAVVIGVGFEAARDKLIAALNQPGPGTLVHPDYGTMQVSITAARMRRISKQKGKVTFSISFVPGEGSPRYPTSVNDTASAVESGADNVTAAANDDFVQVFTVEGLPSHTLTSIENELGTSVAELEKSVGDIAGAAAAEIRAPANMAAIISGGVARIATAVTEPARAVELYKTLFNTGSNSPVIPTATATGKQQARSTDAIHRILQRNAVAEAARRSATTRYTTAQDALTTRDELLLAIDTQMDATDPVSGAPIDDALYQTLHDLRAAVATDLRTRGAKLPQVTHYTPTAVLPALVVAYNVYGDASRDAELIARNNIAHPGFVPGGEPLEILANV